MKVQLLGAAQTVTGSCYMIEACGKRFCIDCGMHQGNKAIEQRNRDIKPYLPGNIDFILITHAHIDHSGLLPRLAVLGFRGPIYATPATIDLLEVLLPDSAHIQEKESEWQLRHQHRRGKGGSPGGIQPPLYTVIEAQYCLGLLQPVNYGETLRAAEGVKVCFHDAGHILGSSWLEVTLGGEGHTRKLVFSGDLGMRDRPVLRDPERPVPEADLLLIESTYGDRLHRPMAETEDEIVAALVPFEDLVGDARQCAGDLWGAEDRGPAAGHRHARGHLATSFSASQDGSLKDV